jgi:hypothetical protein
MPKKPKHTLKVDPISKGVQTKKRSPALKTSTLYRLTVYLQGGIYDDEYSDKEISRTIEIKGNQTLEQLQSTIFKAFEFDDMHLFQFEVMKLPEEIVQLFGPSQLVGDAELGSDYAGDVAKTTMDSLGLVKQRAFYYEFDFGDRWEYMIVVDDVGEAESGKRYPKVVSEVGKAPPQYPDLDEF